MNSRFEIISYGYGMTPKIHVLPPDTTEESAIETARAWKADPHLGFNHLQEVREIEVS